MPSTTLTRRAALTVIACCLLRIALTSRRSAGEARGNATPTREHPTGHDAAAPPPLPWRETGSVPLPARVQSIEITRVDEPIFADASSTSARRGSGQLGARLPIFALRAGTGCNQRWLMVGPLAWLCPDQARFSELPPLSNAARPRTSANGLPMDYYFVGPAGALGYASLSLAEQGISDLEWQPGFALAIRQRARGSSGTNFGLTSKGFWVEMGELRPAQPQTGLLQNHPLDHDARPGWVIAQQAPVYAEAAGRRTSQTRLRFESVSVYSKVRRAGSGWLRIGTGAWLRASDVRVFRPRSPPPSVHAEERWIDVDLEQQILTAYRGPRPIFSTLASTGRGRGASELATPIGEHRVWVKLRSHDMSNLENAEARRYYSMDDVPWVMFFEHGYGLHGAFWHRSFGRVRSHGCVNLAPADAETLFHWAGPRLPAGWAAVHPTEYDPGTRVVVR